ncbi:MAG: site-specific DNA-methyltransferase [Epulopiscium sp.]|nr:site-specific DNA-methyltransferase [Candidatus Epulonipiscium sp.]
MENKVSQKIFNPISEKIMRLKNLFPGVVKDGQVDFEALRQELGQFEVAGKEKYELTWPGKTEAKQLINSDIIGKTLKYVPEDSKNPEKTENLYIEGDNLDILMLLRNSYFGKIKMIYIDPPYNTGNDFIYKDDFKAEKKQTEMEEGYRDEFGERLIKNQKSSSHYHSNWLNMMIPRISISKELLTDEGVIFISIDENEYPRLRMICDEVFERENHIADFVWQNKKGGGNDSKHVAIEHEYIVMYAKNKELVDELYELYSEQYLKRYKEEDQESKFYWDTFKRKSGKQYYPIICPDGTILQYDENGNPISWLRSEKRFKSDLEKGDVRIVKIDDRWSVQFKQRLPKGKKPRSIYESDTLLKEAGTTSDGSSDLLSLFGKDVFSNPKPVELIKYLIGFSMTSDDILLDFFSGSATVAHAIMELNANDGGNRKYILAQLPENLDDIYNNTEANKRLIIQNAIDLTEELGKPHLLTEIGKERIRRAGEKIKQDFKDKEGIENLDIGFKVFKVADTNIKWNSEVLKEGQITMEESALKNKDLIDFNPGFTDIDVVYEIMLRHRDFPLTSKIEKLSNIGERTYIFADAIVVCLEEKVTDKIVDGIAAIEPKPIKVIFRDSAFEDDISLKLNTMNRLDAQLKKHNQGKEQSYRVEFI